MTLTDTTGNAIICHDYLLLLCGVQTHYKSVYNTKVPAHQRHSLICDYI